TGLCRRRSAKDRRKLRKSFARPSPPPSDARDRRTLPRMRLLWGGGGRLRCWLRDGHRQHDLMCTRAVVAQVAGDDVVGVAELEALLMPVAHHGAPCVVGAV